MKLCINCKHMEKKAMPVGENQMAMVPICIHPELADPIQGEVLPCVHVRGNIQFCGIEGKFFELKEEQPLAKPTEKGRIQLA